MSRATPAAGPPPSSSPSSASPASAALASSKAPLVFCGNVPQPYRPTASGSTTPASSTSSSSPSPTPPTAAVRGQFIVQADVPSPRSPPPEDLVWLKRDEQQRLNELDEQLRRVFAQPGAGRAAAATATGRSTASGLTQTTAAAGSAVVQYALGSTLLPQGIADLISNISLLARVSLKCSAFFIEVLIEAARISTGAGLGITRRALISAVASARNVSSRAANMLPGPSSSSSNSNSNDPAALRALSKTTGPAFLTVLDRYTSLGIYLIHHTFTLAELFAMSGFYLTSTGLKMGLGAADESVRMLDQIFGSNETSRALSGFLSLLRRELGPEGVTKSDSLTGSVKTMAYLTKAITAFAVLQNMTFRRSLAEQRLKVIYDCTVLGEAETNSWRARLWGTGSFVPARKTSLLVGSAAGGPHHAISLLPGAGEVPASRRNASTTGAARPRSGLIPRPLSVGGAAGFDLRQRAAGEGVSAEAVTEDDIMANLDFLVGEDFDDEDDLDGGGEDTLMDEPVRRNGTGTGSRGRSGSILSARRVRPAELTEELRLALQQHGDRELMNGVIVSQRTEPVPARRRSDADDSVHRPSSGSGGRGSDSRQVRRTIRKLAGERSGEVVFEMITEIVETTETTTTVEARAASPSPNSGSAPGAEEGGGGGSGPRSMKWGRGLVGKGKRDVSGMTESSSSRTLVPASGSGTGSSGPPTPTVGPLSKSATQQQQQRKASLNNWLPAVFQPLKAGEKRTERDVTSTRSEVDTESVFEDRVERTRMEEDTWCEISTVSQQQRRKQQAQRHQQQQQLDPEQFGGALQRLSSVEGVEPARSLGSGVSEDEVEHELVFGEGEGGIIPTSPNGAPAIAAGSSSSPASSAAVNALRESLERPEQSRARMQVVLKTMTKKLIQRKRILRKITVKEQDDGARAAVERRHDDDDDGDEDEEAERAARLLWSRDEDEDAMDDRTGGESGLSEPHATGLGLGIAGSEAGGEKQHRPPRGAWAGLIDFGSSPATSEGSRTPRGAGVGPDDGSRKASGSSAGGGAGTLQRAFGRARDAVRGTGLRSGSSSNNPARPAAAAADSDVSMRSASSLGHDEAGPSPSLAGGAVRSPTERLLSPAPVVPTRARNNISAHAVPLGGEGEGEASAAGAGAGGGGGSNRGSMRKGKRASRSAFGVPFLGAQYDPSIDGTGAGAGNGHANALLYSPPALGSRRHSRAPSITSVHSFTSRTHTHTNTTAHNSPYLSSAGGGGPAHASSRVRSPAMPFTPELGANFPGEPHDGEASGNAYFPHSHLVKNLHRFMRHSSAAYGQNFMRIFGIGQADYFFPDTSKHHANVWSFAHHVGLDVDKILLSSFTEGGTGPFHSDKMSPLVNYVSVDDESRAIVFACRGTLGLSDILTDLTCTYEPITVPGGSPEGDYKVHAGMLSSARHFRAQSSTVFSTIQSGLQEHPEYGLVLAGHSLGGGVCSVLSVLWSVPAPVFLQQIEQIKAKGLEPPSFPPITTPFVTSLSSGLPPGRPIHAYAYGPPATTTADLSRYCRGLVTSLTHGYDLVPFLSLGSVRDLKNVAKSLAEERETDVAQEIVARTIGLLQYRRQKKEQAVTASPGVDGSEGPARISAAGLQDYDEDSMSQAQPIAEERVQAIEVDELAQGRTANRADQPGYRDPNLARPAPAGSSTMQDELDADAELNQWLWAVIKTMRADMKEEKLYPPGHVYCIESFAVFVTPRMSRSSAHSRQQDYDRLAASKGHAHRVVLRYVDDVEKRFSELIWSMSMLRDHIPTNYEFCTQLLCESVVPEEADISLR